MSKIKDYLAEVEGIDDLMPPRKPDLKDIAGRVAANVDYNSAVDEIKNKAEYEVCADEEGHAITTIRNYAEICDQIAECTLDLYIQEQHLDLTDLEYAEVWDMASDIIADAYEDAKIMVIREYEADQEEKWAQFTSYNAATLPKE